MILKSTKTYLNGLQIKQRKKFFDNRGYLSEILNSKIFLKNKFKIKNTLVTQSKKNVLRGFHYQKKKPIAHIVTCIKGSILDVVVDIRKDSETFGKYESFILSEKNNLTFYIPKGFAHGFLTLENNSIIIYHTSNEYIRELDSGFIWNDDFVNFRWPVKNPILSVKDKNLNNFISEFNLKG